MEAFVLQEHDEWLADHLEELLRRYPSKVVAIHEGQVVYTGESELGIPSCLPPCLCCLYSRSRHCRNLCRCSSASHGRRRKTRSSKALAGGCQRTSCATNPSRAGWRQSSPWGSSCTISTLTPRLFGFSERLGVGFNVLGRTRVFNQFQICFNDRTRPVTFQKL
jgi:hypothetical protein